MTEPKNLTLLTKTISDYQQLSKQMKDAIEARIETCIKGIIEDKSIDIDLQQHLLSAKNDNQIISVQDFPGMMNEIDKDSLIIYVKKARSYKIYKPNNLEDFTNDNNTHYRKSEYGPAYEVVRDTHPQKLMIVITKDLTTNQLKMIKDCIKEFVKDVPEIKNESTLNDIRSYSNANNTELLVGRFRVENLVQKENIIERFIAFMQKKGGDDETEIANKIQVKPPVRFEAPGARFYDLPVVKKSLDGLMLDTNISEELISHLVSTDKEIHIHLTNINGNNNTVHSSNVGNTINKTTNKTGKSTKKTLETFYKHICDTKPSWYLEERFVEIEKIEKAYRDYFNDNSISRAMISRSLNGNLFNGTSRPSGITKKKLVSYDTLKSLY